MAKDYTVIKCQVCGVCWDDHATESPDCKRTKPEGKPDPEILAAVKANRDTSSPIDIVAEPGETKVFESTNGQLKTPSLNDPEPPSIDSGNVACWEYAIQDFRFRNVLESYCDPIIAIFRERNEIGIKKYGKPVMINNGRNALVDVFQEFLDAYVYMAQKLMETKITDPNYSILDLIQNRTETSIIQIHAMLTAKDSR